MGQQQLLLIILGVIIVGIAIAVGLSLFSAQSIQANKDAIINDLNNLAANAYQYRIRPTTMGGGGGGSGSQTVTQVKEMPAWAQPYAQNLLESGMQAIEVPVQEYQGMRVAPQNAWQQQAMSMAAGRALSGAPDEIAARQQNLATQTGQYLGANPWLGQDYTQRAIDANAQSMGRGYATGTAAQLDAAAARARARSRQGLGSATWACCTNRPRATRTMCG